ncbi:MAG: hypothetical protein sL5_07250 [Candidatus Mesenet longicola]|uniref:Uncharacterized protein n=1 Tax=Candidatus Mesenet longicola TaxID=1892558 RepID=A0A8J3MN14_9RICK|nr:MAG: hypothetical protein sL5_07250 [Candidatus Mesenet longicola]
MYKLYATWCYWYCGPNDTKAGHVARMICWLSTISIVTSGIFYLPYYVAATYIDHSKIKHDVHPSLFVKFSTMSFYLGLLDYIVTPVIGHGFCSMIGTTHRDQIVNIGQEDYELPSSITILPSYQELFFSDEPPSYEEISIV